MQKNQTELSALALIIQSTALAPVINKTPFVNFVKMNKMKKQIIFIIFIAVFALLAGNEKLIIQPAFASQSLIDLLDFNPSEQTLIIYNSNTQDGQEIAEYYANAREISTNRICATQFPPGLFATAEEFMGARKHIIENCICNAIQEIHPDQYPSPCDISNLEEISAISPITHIVLIKGIPTRLYNTSWPTDSGGPSLDYYLSISLYDHNDLFDEGTTGNIPQSSYYSSDTEGSKQTDNGDLGYVRQIIPAVDKIVAYGRVEAMTKQRTFDLINRTLVAENQGITGNLTVGLPTTPENSRTFKFFRDLINSNSDACVDCLIDPYSEWPYETCRVGGTANGGIPGELSTITMPRGMNISIYMGNEYSGNSQDGFDGLPTMLNWHKTEYDCVELCKDFTDPTDEQNCRDNSTDYFKEINTECVGAADGLIGWQYRSFPVQFMGFWPDKWTQTSSGSMFKTPPDILSGGAYQDVDYIDDKYLRFGNDSKISNSQCVLDDGSVVDCPEKVGVNLRYYKSFSPYITIDGSKNYTMKFRYRNTATSSGILYARLAVRYDGDSNNTTISTHSVDLDSVNEDWTLKEFSFVLNTDGATYNRLNIDLYSSINSAPNGFIDFDAVELFDDDTGERIIDINTSSFNDPYINSTHSGDYASNAIERLGGIAWWGSASHHLTGGHAFVQPQKMTGAFYAGRTLGESIAVLGSSAKSGIVYGDPLYRPSGAKIYIGNYWEETNNSDLPFEFMDDENSIHSLRINAFHGKNNIDSTNWQVSICRENDVNYCDQQNIWNEYATGTQAVYDYEILSDLTSLVINENKREEFIVRLRVWNVEEEENDLYSYAYFEYNYAYYIDNELTTGNNDGSDWENAFKSILDLNNNITNGIYNSIYIKATETPYREMLSYTKYAHSTFYLDATGIGQERGNNKVVFYGSDQIGADGWIDEGNGVYSTTTISTDSKTFLDSISGTIRGVYSVNGINDTINSLTMVNSQDELNNSTNNFYYASSTLYIYLDGNEPTKPIEVSARDCVNLWNWQKLYGGVFRFGKNGNSNMVFGFIISNCIFEHNAYSGFSFSTYKSDFNETKLSKNIFRNNGVNGIYCYRPPVDFNPDGHIRVSQNLIYDNDNYGIMIYNYFGFLVNLDYAYLHIYNNSIYNNQNGIYFFSEDFCPIAPYVFNIESYNNIVFSNSQEDFKVNDTTDPLLYSFSASNNNFNPLISATWEIFAGSNNISSQPIFIDENNNDFNLTKLSPTIDAGINVNLTTDYAGNLIYGIPDIGAYEYQPPYTIGINDIPTTGSIRIYSDGKYGMKTASTTSAVASFSITPESGSYLSTTTQYMDITINTWNMTGNHTKQWTATSITGDFHTQAGNTIYTIGDLLPNTAYTLKVDGIASTAAIADNSYCASGVCTANANGQIKFTYTGGYSTAHTFGLEKKNVGGGIPFWILKQINNANKTDGGEEDSSNSDGSENDSDGENNNDGGNNKADKNSEGNNHFVYGKARLKSLPQEQNSAKELKQKLEEFYSKGKIPVHKKHWHTIVNSYIYGDYPIQAIIQAIKFGGKTVHPIIPFSAWKTAKDYLEWIGR